MAINGIGVCIACFTEYNNCIEVRKKTFTYEHSVHLKQQIRHSIEIKISASVHQASDS